LTALNNSLLIGGEIAVERQRLIEGYDCYEVGGLHLLVDVVAGRILRPFQIFRLHRGDVEEHHDQAMIA